MARIGPIVSLSISVVHRLAAWFAGRHGDIKTPVTVPHRTEKTDYLKIVHRDEVVVLGITSLLVDGLSVGFGQVLPWFPPQLGNRLPTLLDPINGVKDTWERRSEQAKTSEVPGNMRRPGGAGANRGQASPGDGGDGKGLGSSPCAHFYPRYKGIRGRSG
jgi:hypothetical protein